MMMMMIMMVLHLSTHSPHPHLKFVKNIQSPNNFYTFPGLAQYSILNTDHSEVMGGKIESDANMSNQRINLNKLTGDLLSHYLHSDPSHPTYTYNSENSVKYIFISVFLVATDGNVYICVEYHLIENSSTFYYQR